MPFATAPIARHHDHQAGAAGPWLLGLLAAVAVVGALGVFAFAGKPAYAPARGGQVAEGQPGTGNALPAGDDRARTAAPATGASAPEGVSEADWAAVQQALAQHPQREAELQRIGQLLSYQARVRHFQEARQAGATGAELRAMARQLDGELDQHLANNEISAGEARVLKASLLAQLQPDASARALALATWQHERAAASPHQADPRDARYLQAQASTVAAWQAQPAAQRSEAQLGQQLGAVRGQVYANNSSAGGSQP